MFDIQKQEKSKEEPLKLKKVSKSYHAVIDIDSSGKYVGYDHSKGTVVKEEELTQPEDKEAHDWIKEIAEECADENKKVRKLAIHIHEIGKPFSLILTSIQQ